MTRRIEGLSEIAHLFDAILVDQFGVLHDGAAAYDGARDCLDRLKGMGLPIAALTNSGKRAEANSKRLARLNFPRALFMAVISSGELARAHVETMLRDGDLRPGARVAVISRDGDMETLGGLGLALGPPSGAADLVLIAGATPETTRLDAYREMIAPLAKAGVPALCANPDRWMQTGRGVAFGAGQIAEAYQQLGGVVTMLGKPSAKMFDAALLALGDPSPERVLMIGDSLEHDIAGAAAMGLRTLFVRSGPQSGTVAVQEPDYSISALAWAGRGG